MLSATKVGSLNVAVELRKMVLPSANADVLNMNATMQSAPYLNMTWFLVLLGGVMDFLSIWNDKGGDAKNANAFSRKKQKPPAKIFSTGGSNSFFWWPRAESNHRHKDFQSSALPTELLGHIKRC
jgi:hypothetical protein